MFKAFDTTTASEIVSIDPAWEDRRLELRAHCAGKLLQCPECRQPVRLRAGEFRRAHFAHEHKLQCSLNGESADVLNLRAALYGWLTSKFGAAVEIEKQDCARSFPRPIDCWHNGPKGPLGYVTLARGMSTMRRERLQKAILDTQLQATFVFHASTLEIADGHPNCIVLSTTHRDFAVSTKYDQPHYSGYGSSVHFLDPETGMLTTYRGLGEWHPPQVYRGVRVTSNLSDVLVSPKTGEFVHPGEVEALRNWRDECAARAHAARTRTKRPAPPPPVPRTPSAPKATCVICGQITHDYLQFDERDNTCRCLECRRAGRY